MAVAFDREDSKYKPCGKLTNLGDNHRTALCIKMRRVLQKNDECAQVWASGKSIYEGGEGIDVGGTTSIHTCPCRTSDVPSRQKRKVRRKRLTAEARTPFRHSHIGRQGGAVTVSATCLRNRAVTTGP